MAGSGCCRRASRFISPATLLPDSQDFPGSKDSSGRCFPAAARLRNSGEFAAVRAQGRMAQGRWLRMTALRLADDSPARLGAVTSRRVGGAVQRNRVRRRLREIFRDCRSRLPAGLWLVVTAKPGAAEAEFAALREEWLRLADRLSIFRTLQ